MKPIQALNTHIRQGGCATGGGPPVGTGVNHRLRDRTWARQGLRNLE